MYFEALPPNQDFNPPNPTLPRRADKFGPYGAVNRENLGEGD